MFIKKRKISLGLVVLFLALYAELSVAESCELGILCSAIDEDKSNADTWIYLEKNDEFDGSKHCYIRSPDMYYEDGGDLSKVKFHMKFILGYGLLLSYDAKRFFDGDAEIQVEVDDSGFYPINSLTSDAMEKILFASLANNQRLTLKYRKYNKISEFVIPFDGFDEVRKKWLSCAKSENYKSPPSWGLSEQSGYKMM